jgi:hypothetical protein
MDPDNAQTAGMTSAVHASKENKQEATLPFSEDSEKGLICSLLLAPDEVMKHCARRVSAKAFHIPAHRLLFDTICEWPLPDKAVDFIWLKDTLKDRNQLAEVGDKEYLSDLFGFVPSAENAGFYAQIVADKYARRQIMKSCRQIIDASSNGEEDLHAILQENIQRIEEIARQNNADRCKGNSPVDYLKAKICSEDILLGDGFLERASAVLLAGPSGIGKSSIAMQVGCCWSCGETAFDFKPPRTLRIVMMQHEDSRNDLVRQSESLRFLGLNEQLIHRNFWIETVRGKIGPEAISVMRDLVKWHRADILMLNPLSAYHNGDISQNKDNIKFLYGELGALLDELRIGLFAFHHKGKPAKGQHGKKNQHEEDVYYQVMYDILGGSTLTNFFRGIITVSPIANSEVFKFTVAKRFEESGWPLKVQHFKWDEDRSKRVWIPASVAESTEARKTSGKTLQDLYKLAPISGAVPKNTFKLEVMRAGFTRNEYEGLLAQALDDDTPDTHRLYQWRVYNPHGLAKAAISRYEQPANESHEVIRQAKAQERKALQAREHKPAKSRKAAKGRQRKAAKTGRTG